MLTVSFSVVDQLTVYCIGVLVFICGRRELRVLQHVERSVVSVSVHRALRNSHQRIHIEEHVLLTASQKSAPLAQFTPLTAA